MDRSRSMMPWSSPATSIFTPWATASAGTGLPNMRESSGSASLTGILLPDEKPGLIPTTEWKKKRTGDVWRTADNYINSIGQGFVLVSPIQAAQMIGAVANGGTFYRPSLLKMTRNRETGEVQDLLVRSATQKIELRSRRARTRSGRRCSASRRSREARPMARPRRWRPLRARPEPPR